MVIIADTTPLRYLVEIGCADLLHRLFERILIPRAVAAELHQPRTPAGVRAWLSAAPEWLEIRDVEQATDHSLNHLGAGEREAILVAEQTGADWLIVDDREGRREAERRRIPVLGTLRVLDEGADRGLIPLPEVLLKLSKTNFYVDPKLLKWLLTNDAKRRE